MQLHLYLPDDVAEEVRKRAESKGMPVSRYLAELRLGGDLHPPTLEIA